jgi:hypothetical protein
MERRNFLKLTVAAATAVGLRYSGLDSLLKKGSSPTPDSQSSATFASSPTNSEVIEENFSSPGSIDKTEVFPPTQTVSPVTPEIPFGEHKCVLPLKVPFRTTTGFKEPLKDKSGKFIYSEEGILLRHMGLDLGDVKEGDDVFSLCDSELLWVGAVVDNEGKNLGNVVVIKDVVTENVLLLAHLSQVTDKKPGEKILAGEKIGEIGCSGGWGENNVHLHITVFTKEGWKLIAKATQNNYAGDYARSLTPLYVKLQKITNEEEIAKRLIDPAIYIYQKTGIKVWEL